MDVSRLISKLREQDFGPDESVIASTVMNPKLAASKAADWFAGQMAKATNTPDPYDNPTPLRGYNPEEQVEGAFNLAGLAQTGAFPMAPSGAGTVGSIKAFHGSPHKFERFDMSKIGTGEGAQAYGHGLYFAENPQVARDYRDALAGFEVGGKVLTPGWDDPNYYPIQALIKHGNDIEKARQDVIKRNSGSSGAWQEELDAFESLAKQGIKRNQGHLYETSLEWPDPAREAADPLGPEHFLQWDRPLSEQPTGVQRALMNLATAHKLQPEMTGGQLYESTHLVPGEFTDPDAAAKALKKLGIPGIRYLDQGSRGAGEGTYNYVVFDDRIPKIIEINGQPVDVSNLANKLRGE